MTNTAISFSTRNYQDEIKGLIAQFIADKGLTIAQDHINEYRKNVDQKNPLLNLIKNNIKENQTLVVYDAMDLGRSTLEVIEVFNLVMEKNLTLYVAKYNEEVVAGSTTDTSQFLRVLQQVESEFAVLKMTDRIGRRRHSGASLGRPKGSSNKELKLDKHLKDIKRYIDLDISKASIAKLIDCHPQTLYNYIDKKDLAKKTKVKA